MKKKKIIFILGILFLIGLAASFIQIYKVNAEYPNAKLLYIPVGNAKEVMDGINLSVISSKWLSKNEAAEKYDKYIAPDTNNDTKVITIDIEMSNTTEKELKAPVYTIYIESDLHYSNGLDIERYMIDNLNQSAEIILKPKEKIKLTLVYSIFSNQFKKNQWDNIRKYKFYLINKRYPQKICWELQ